MTKFPKVRRRDKADLKSRTVGLSTRHSKAEDNRDKQQRIFNVSLLELGSARSKAGILTASESNR